MAFRDSEIGLAARTEPEKARRLLRAAYTRQKYDAQKTAAHFGISRRQFDRIARALGLDGEFAALRKKRAA